MKNELNTVYNFTEEIEDINALDATYEIWAIGYDEDGDITDSELFIDSFDNPDDAIKAARAISLTDIIDLDAESSAGFFDEHKRVTYVSIEVETVVEVPEDDYVENIGTIFTKELYR